MLSKEEFRGGFLALGGILVVVYALAVVTPGLPGELLLQSLWFHLAAAGLVVVLALLVTGARWRGALLLAVVLGFAGLGASIVWEQHKRRDVAPAGSLLGTVEYLSYNVLANNQTGAAAADYIVNSGADVVFVMETAGVGEYLDKIRSSYPYSVGCDADQACDSSLYSRYPITKGTLMTLPPYRQQRLITATIDKDGMVFSVLGIHLSKPYFDYASQIELARAKRVLSAMEGPVIVSGDFNAASWSEPVDDLVRAADLVPPPYPPATWPVIAGPLGVPIDNMFTRGPARISTIAAGEDSFGSNHRYLRAQVSIYSGS